MDAPALFANPFPVRATTTLTLPKTIDSLSPATVFITPMHSNPVATKPLLTPITLNRPENVSPPANSIPVNLQFGESITLESYALITDADKVDLALYWQTDHELSEDYQIFVHVLNAEGYILTQADTTPVQGRYPTSQWRVGVTITDLHTILVEDLPDDFSIRLGMYRLPDATRLPVTPTDARVQNDSVMLRGK